MAIMLPNPLRKNRILESCLHLEVGLRAEGVSAVEGRSLVNVARVWQKNVLGAAASQGLVVISCLLRAHRSFMNGRWHLEG
jgi:hypothetical protein